MDGISPLALALLGTGFTFFMTAAGAAMVFFFRKEVSADQQRLFLGFAAGLLSLIHIYSGMSDPGTGRPGPGRDRAGNHAGSGGKPHRVSGGAGICFLCEPEKAGIR